MLGYLLGTFVIIGTAFWVIGQVALPELLEGGRLAHMRKSEHAQRVQPQIASATVVIRRSEVSRRQRIQMWMRLIRSETVKFIRRSVVTMGALIDVVRHGVHDAHRSRSQGNATLALLPAQKQSAAATPPQGIPEVVTVHHDVAKVA